MPALVYKCRMSRLTLHYVPEDEWHGELTAWVVSSDYAGRSSARFTVDQLRSFCGALEAFPISPDAPASLEGGFWKEKEEVIDQLHVGLSVSPFDGLGGLVVSVRLATPIWKSEGRDLLHKVVAYFRTDYPSLDRFRSSFLALIDGQSEVAELDGL